MTVALLGSSLNVALWEGRDIPDRARVSRPMNVDYPVGIARLGPLRPEEGTKACFLSKAPYPATRLIRVLSATVLEL
jgi:hypothetical protein